MNELNGCGDGDGTLGTVGKYSTPSYIPGLLDLRDLKVPVGGVLDGDNGSQQCKEEQ